MCNLEGNTVVIRNFAEQKRMHPTNSSLFNNSGMSGNQPVFAPSGVNYSSVPTVTQPSYSPVANNVTANEVSKEELIKEIAILKVQQQQLVNKLDMMQQTNNVMVNEISQLVSLLRAMSQNNVQQPQVMSYTMPNNNYQHTLNSMPSEYLTYSNVQGPQQNFQQKLLQQQATVGEQVPNAFFSNPSVSTSTTNMQQSVSADYKPWN